MTCLYQDWPWRRLWTCSIETTPQKGTSNYGLSECSVKRLDHRKYETSSFSKSYFNKETTKIRNIYLTLSRSFELKNINNYR